MKFTSGELPDDVEEDGACDFIDADKKLDNMTSTGKPLLTDRNGEVEEALSKGGNSEVNTNNNNMSRTQSIPQPTEHGLSDSEDNTTGTTPDSLVTALSKVTISDKVKSVSEIKPASEVDDLSSKISNVTLDEKPGVEGGEQYTEIKESEITTLAEIEKRKKEEAETEEPKERGPNHGIPKNHNPDVDRYDHVAGKNYPASVSRQLCSQFPGNYSQAQQMYNSNLVCQQRSTMNGFQQGVTKRSRDEYDQQPYKYTKPVEPINNLSDPSKTQTSNLTFSNVVSTKGFSGGQVMVNSPDLESMIPSFQCGDTANSGEFDILNLLSQGEESLKDPERSMCSEILVNAPYSLQHGYHNNIMRQNPQLVQGSYLDQTQVNVNPMMENVWRQKGGENRTSFSAEDSASEGYVSEGASSPYSPYSPYSEIQDSPTEQTMYSPPPSVDSGACMTSASSPGSTIDIGSPRSSTMGFESNLDVFDSSSRLPPTPTSSHQTVQTNGYAPPMPGFQSNMAYQGLDYQGGPVNPVHQTGYLQTAGVAPGKEMGQNSSYIDNNLETFLDVIETIGEDLVKAEHKKKQKTLTKGMQETVVPVQKQAPVPQQQKLPATSQSGPRKNVPVASVQPNQIHRQVPTTSTPVLLVKQTPSTMGVPISVAPSVVNSQQMKVSSQSPVTNGQILVIPATPQIVFVASPPQPQTKKTPTYRSIRPKIQPNPVPGIAPASDSRNVTLSSSPKSVTTPKPAQPSCPVSPMTSGQVSQCPNKPQPSTPKTNVNQLNIARRCVATMTAEELKCTDQDGDTYLHVAVCKADKYMVQALLERILRENLQTMIDTQNSERQTPVYLAVSANQPEMVEMLIKYGADVNLLAERTSTNGQKEVKAAIHSASSNGKDHLATLQSLLKAQELNLNMFNSDGCTALHCAILEHSQPRPDSGTPTDSKPIIEALIRAGADPNSQDKKSGKTAFMYALETRDYTLIDTLLTLVDITKVRCYFRTQAFDGSTCVKIMESRKAEFPPKLYDKLTAIMSNNRSILSHR
ncbi:uncharacterized protein [Haliotis cracherodii]|uniref:uncharacterized protein isoform X1 n=2 Tax=Haliotis cracherodii TaxID=6455 RepID=UPI0039EB63DE